MLLIFEQSVHNQNKAILPEMAKKGNYLEQGSVFIANACAASASDEQSALLTGNPNYHSSPTLILYSTQVEYTGA
ncbi:MAG TPA: hypothetical protein PK299_04430 [Anaerolineales bacterium]|nr:hypothetical protein [Anaerolineales bacterium]